MRNIVLSAFTAVAALFVFNSFAATTVQWSGAGGDMDLTNEQNWPNRTLPTSPDYNAQLTATTEDKSYTMLKATSLLSWEINLLNGLTLDLGKGNSFLAAEKLFVNTTDQAFNLKSGTFGVDWNSSTGERFFIGDSGKGGNTFNVSGEDSVLVSSYKSSIQVGTNLGHQRLNVTDGATLRANLSVGNNRTAGDNVAWIENATHIVPADSTATPLYVGCVGANNTYVLTNKASFVNKREANIYVSGTSNHERSEGGNRLVVTDHSSFTTPGTVDVGYGAHNNALEVSDHSTFSCNVFNLTYEIDGSMVESGGGPRVTCLTNNTAVVRGVGSLLAVSVNADIGGKSKDTTFRLDDGATMTVGNTLMIGSTSSTNTLAYFGTNTVTDALLGFSIGTQPDAFANRAVFDGASFFYTNQVSTGRVAGFGTAGISNATEFVNGAYGLLNSPGGTVYIGNGDTSHGNSLAVRDSGTLLQFFDQSIYVGSEKKSNGNVFRIDGGTVAITNPVTARTFGIGHQGPRNTLEVMNGGLLTFSNVNFIVCSSRGDGSNVVRVANGGRIQGIIKGGGITEGIYIGQYAVGGLDVDGGSFVIPQLLRVSHTEATGGGSWVKIRNGGYIEVNRVIMGEMTQGNRIDIDNGTLVTLGDSIQMGTNDSRCSNDVLTITGTNAFVRSGGGLAISPQSVVQFDIGEFGFCKTAAVVRVMSNVNGTTSVTAENPVTIRITDDNPKRIEGGKYTLIEAKNGKINWDLINLEYPPSVRIVEKTDKKLVVRVPSRKGMLLLVR